MLLNKSQKSNYNYLIGRITLVLFLCILFTGCNQIQQLSPSPSETFFKLYGGAYEQEAADIIETEDGGFLLFGSSNSYNQGENWDFFLVKTDSDGNEVWNRTYDFGGMNDKGNVLIPAHDEGYMLCGTSIDQEGTPKVRLLNIDINGNEQWRNPIERTGTGEDLIETSDGGYILVGTTPDIDPSKADGFSDSIQDATDILVVKLDREGNEQWRKVYGFQGTDAGIAITSLSDGSFAILGTTDFPRNNIINQDFLLILTNKDGNPYFTQRYGSVGEEVAADLTSNGESGLRMFGTRNRKPLFQNISNSLAEDSLISSKDVHAESIIALSGNNYMLVGAIDGGNQNGNDMLLMKVGESGNLIWQNDYGSKGEDIGKKVILLADGDFAFTGTIGFGANTMIGLLKINQKGELLP